MREPYYVYGGMQDNHSWMGPSATRHWIGIINDDWRQIGFGDGMYWQPDPTSHRYVYGNAQNGNYTRLDAETGDLRNIRPYPPDGEPPYRWDWVSPSLISRHDPTVVYVGGNRLFISRDQGASWERTDDLTRRIDRDTVPLMGVLGSDITLSRNDGTSSFGEITTIAESPLDANVLWVGTDDGNVQVSRDGGRSWREVSGNVRGVRSGTYVSRVVASASGRGVGYVTFDAHRDGDFAPYVFRTEDFGRTWTPLAGTLPDGSVNVLAEHRQNPNLLFLGTEHALFASTDRGEHWAEFGQLPTTLYDDLVIHPRENDLVVGTHGRSIFILDDVTPLVEWTRSVAQGAVHVFSIRRATIMQYWKDTSYRGQAAYAGENPPDGAMITYYLREDADTARVSVVNTRGDTVRRFEVPGSSGMHRVVWDLRHEPPPTGGSPFGQQQPPRRALPVLPHPVSARGPFVSPGTYTVTLEADGRRATRTVVVRGDPLMPLTQADWEERERFLVGLVEMQRASGEAAQRASALYRRLVTRRDSLRTANEAVPDDLTAAVDSAQALGRRLRALRGQAGQLTGQVNGFGVRQGTLYPPTATQRRRREAMEARLRTAVAELAALEERVR